MVRILFLKGILEEYVEILNLMTSGDVSHRSFEEITELCRKYSRSRAKVGRSVGEGASRTSRTTGTSGVTRIELGNLLENFNTDILGTLSSQFDVLKTKRRQEEEDIVALHIFYPKCRKRHPLKECPLNVISVCALYSDKHPTDNFPSLPELQALYKINNEPMDQSYASKSTWYPRPQNMYLEPTFQNSAYFYPMQQP